MNSKAAKRLRRAVYNKHRGHRRGHKRGLVNYVQDPDTGTVYAVGLRRQYQDIKRALRHRRVVK